MTEYKNLLNLLKYPPAGRDNADVMIVAAYAIEQLRKERDAAVADISAIIENKDPCKICKHRFADDPTDCIECDDESPWGNFEWIGDNR